MNTIFRLDEVTVLDVVGDDAQTILHNLTTNDVKALQQGCGCETFITEVRGRTIGHVEDYRTADGFRLIGAPGQAETIANQTEKYTITEDVQPQDRSGDFTAFVIHPQASSSLRDETDWTQCNAIAFDTQWLGTSTLVVLTETPGAVEQVCVSCGEPVADQQAFHMARVQAGFPWYGIDFSEKNLPQEVNRIEQTISFTKGCYLGQETVARLDALGQVQKQLVRWQTEGSMPAPGSEVSSANKVVGRLTSLCPTAENQAIAIGIARRSHFDPGSAASGEGFEAVVR